MKKDGQGEKYKKDKRINSKFKKNFKFHESKSKKKNRFFDPYPYFIFYYIPIFRHNRMKRRRKKGRKRERKGTKKEGMGTEEKTRMDNP